MPIWCDLECPEAAWPDGEGLDGSGSCRTFLAVYCRKHHQLNKKNALCLDVPPGDTRGKIHPALQSIPRRPSKGWRIQKSRGRKTD
ncbi:MAG: hypothetical protein ACE15F_16875 [bacterium]